MAGLTLVLGGVRSGKSSWAERLAAACPPVVYLATALPHPEDKELAARIARHRQRRASHTPAWQTVEEGRFVVEALQAHGQAGCVLLECLTLWLTTLMLGSAGQLPLSDEEIRQAVAALVQAAQQVPARVVVVSNEVGWGIIPDNPLARRFADLLGEANQLLAAAAEEVYLCLAGIPRRWKPA